MSGGSCCCFECITESEAGVLEFCGKFSRVMPSGLFCVRWPFETIVARVSLKIKYMEVRCETKTKDNVFVSVCVAIQYKVRDDAVSAAYYKLTDVRSQMTSYVNDVVRSAIPRMELDEAFASKGVVADAVKEQLTSLMSEYGFEIRAALVIDLDPNTTVKQAMNNILAQTKIREAQSETAEAEKILLVKAAEADAESRYLSGLGVARQRKAIIDGLRETVDSFSREVKGAGAKEVMDLLLVTQYFDMIKEIGMKNTAGSTLFLPHGPQAVETLRADLKDSFVSNDK